VLAGRIRKQMDQVEAQEKKRQADEAARIAEAEQRAREQEATRIVEKLRQEAQALAAEAVGVVAAPAQYPAPEAAPVAVKMRQTVASASVATSAEPATLNVGAINARLGFTVSAGLLANLGIHHTAREKNAMLYRESDWPRICVALMRHIEIVSGLTAT
jgi:hypothetical protein